MASTISDRAMIRGRVKIGDGTAIEANAVLGSSEDGELSIGRDSVVRAGAIIYSGVEIGDRFRSGHSILIRSNTRIGENVLLGTNAVVDGDCEIGNNVSIQTGAYITRYTTIEDGAFLGPLCVTTNDKYMRLGAVLKGPVIGRGARIGANATILPGVTVGRDAVVGAGAVVTKDVAADDIVVGNPARSVKGRRT